MAGTAHLASDATVLLNPLTVSSQSLLSGLGWTPHDLCSVLAHELTHAADFMTGQFPTDDCTLETVPFGSAQFPQSELKAQAAANSYQVTAGYPPVTLYANVKLPDEALRPTAATWERYQQCHICPPTC